MKKPGAKAGLDEGDRTGRPIQNGIRIMMYSRHKVTSTCSRSPPPGSQPGEKNTLTAADSTRPC